MSGPDYHAWTHRPKAQGGTDPIEIETTPGSAVPVEWAKIQSTTNTGTSLTHMNFSIVAGNYDVSTPTFDINGSSNLTIFKDGVYRYDLFMYNSNRGSYTNLYELQATVMRIAGEIPDPLLTTNTILDVRIPDMWGTSSNTAFPQWMPASQIFSYGAGAFPGVGASELEVKCRALLAGAGTADNDVIVLGVITRLGDSYS